jgi:hypothetical protein
MEENGEENKADLKGLWNQCKKPEKTSGNA